VGHNKQISGELRISFHMLKYSYHFLFIIQSDALLMYHKLDYN